MCYTYVYMYIMRLFHVCPHEFSTRCPQMKHRESWPHLLTLHCCILLIICTWNIFSVWYLILMELHLIWFYRIYNFMAVNSGTSAHWNYYMKLLITNVHFWQESNYGVVLASCDQGYARVYWRECIAEFLTGQIAYVIDFRVYMWLISLFFVFLGFYFLLSLVCICLYVHSHFVYCEYKNEGLSVNSSKLFQALNFLGYWDLL